MPSLKTLWFCAAAMSLGCYTNSPGALQLTLSPDYQIISPKDDIRLNAELLAKKGPICLHHHFVAEVDPPEAFGKSMNTDEIHVQCGTGVMECLLLWPIFASVTLLDVQDRLDRYQVLSNAGDRAKHHLEVIHRQNNGQRFYLLREVGMEKRPQSPPAPWPPGEYLVKVRYVDRAEPLDRILPDALFWKPYSQPVEAQATVVVADQ